MVFLDKGRMTRVGACVQGDRLGASITNRVYSLDVEFSSCFIRCLESLIAPQIRQIKGLDMHPEKVYSSLDFHTIQSSGKLSA